MPRTRYKQGNLNEKRMVFAVNIILFSSEHHGYSVVFLHTRFKCSKKGGIPAIPASVSGEKDGSGIFYRLEFSGILKGKILEIPP